MIVLRYLAILLCLLHTAEIAAEPIKIVTIAGAPWGFVGADGKSTGMMFEIGNRIAETAGFSPNNSLTPYARTAVEIEHGGADLLLRFSHEHVLRVAVPIATVIKMPIIVVGPKGSSFANVEALHGKVVGMVRTSKYVEAFDDDDAIQKYPVADYVMMAKMLAVRRLDAGVGSDVGFYYGAYLAGVKPEDLGPPLVLGSNEFVLFLSKRSATPARIQALKAAVKTLQASGEIQSIMDRYTHAYKTYWR